MLNDKAIKIAEILNKAYPSPQTELTHNNPCQLVVAVMLSAQTTDKKVNQITPTLFTKYKSWKDYAKADLKELQKDIHGVNFHLGKADRIIKAAKKMLHDFNGDVPQSMDLLVTIPGVARKSANVILQELLDIAEGIVVDTHVTRVSRRLGLTGNVDPVKIERDLTNLLPKKYWRHVSGALVFHGRYVCKARRPECGTCVLAKLCPSAFKFEQS